MGENGKRDRETGFYIKKKISTTVSTYQVQLSMPKAGIVSDSFPRVLVGSTGPHYR